MGPRHTGTGSLEVFFQTGIPTSRNSQSVGFRLYMEAVVVFCSSDGEYATCDCFAYGFLLAMGSRGGLGGARGKRRVTPYPAGH